MRKLPPTYFLGAALFWASVIFASSSGVITVGQLSRAVSGAAGGHISESGFRQFWGVFWWIFVKGWHAAEFAILYLLLRRATPKVWIALVIAGLFAVSDEFHQLFVPARGCRASDVAIDWSGIAAAWSYAEGWLKRLRERPWILATLCAIWVTLLFLLSVQPFGLVTLGPERAGLASP